MSFLLTAIKSKRQQLVWIIESSRDAWEGDFSTLRLRRRLFSFKSFVLVMTANSGARREEHRSETERASLDFPSDSVHRQSKCCEAALADFWSKKLVDQDHSMCFDSTIGSRPCGHPCTQGLAGHVEMRATRLMLFGCFSFFPFPYSADFSWLDWKNSAGFSFCKRHKHLTLRSHLSAYDLLLWPTLTIAVFSLKSRLANCSLQCVRKKTKQKTSVFVCLTSLYFLWLIMAAMWFHYEDSIDCRKFRWQWGEKQHSVSDAQRRLWENYSLFPLWDFFFFG